MKELNFWKFLSKRLRAGNRLMLLVVVESTGSSPGRAGFKLVVDETGKRCGSIGGGIMEVKLVELAKEQLRAGLQTPLLKKQIHNKSAPKDQSGMICSGEQRVLFFPITGDQAPLVDRLIRCLISYRPALLRIDQSGIDLVEQEKNGQDFAFVQANATEFRYEERIGFKNQLCIIGGGHCALALSEIMSNLDFFIRLYDDRPGLDTLKKNRFAHEKRAIKDYSQITEHLPAGTNVFVVVMTLGYRSDEIVLRQLLTKSFRYIGVLGSAAKMRALLNTLEQEGISPGRLKQIHTPIGLKVNSRTPEEIAVSIAAEIIGVKNEGF